jgi:hypothetical protein
MAQVFKETRTLQLRLQGGKSRVSSLLMSVCATLTFVIMVDAEGKSLARAYRPKSFSRVHSARLSAKKQ